MSIAGKSFGTNHRVCDDAEEKGVSNFDMVDQHLD